MFDLTLPLAVLGAAGLGGAGLGIFHPRVALFGPAIHTGPRHRPAIALSFDDGPHPRFTARISEILAARGARATFFCVGREVERHPSLARELVAAGHQLGNHTYRHNTGWDLFSAERLTADLQRCQYAIASVTGVAPVHYRPAVGIRNPVVHAAARNLGLTIVTWSDAARDGVRRFTANRAHALGKRARAGDILALHDGTLSDRETLREATVTHLGRLLDELDRRELALVTISELLGSNGVRSA